MADPVFTDTATFARVSAAASLTFSHTITNGNYLHCGVSSGLAVGHTISSLTWNGTAQTNVISEIRNNQRATIFGTPAGTTPATGTFDIVVTPSTSTNIACGACNYNNVNTTTNRGTPTSVNNNVSPASVASISSAAGELIVDCLMLAPGTTATVDAAQTQRVNNNATNQICAMSDKPGAVNETMTWTFTPNDSLAIAAVSLKPSVDGRTTKNIHPWTLGLNAGIGLGLPGGGQGS